MKKILLLLMALLVTPMISGKSVFEPFHVIPAKKISQLIESELVALYLSNEDQRKVAFKRLKTSVTQPLKDGDRFYVYTIFSHFVTGWQMPEMLKSDSNAKEGINDLREEVLEFLIDEVNNSKRSISDREYLLTLLSNIAGSENLFEFKQNQMAIKALGKNTDNDHSVLRHAAIIGLKDIILKTGEKWEQQEKLAAEYLADTLESGYLEQQRTSFLESIDVLKRAQGRTDGVKLLWEKILDELPEIKSEALKKSIHYKLRLLVGLKAGVTFERQVKITKEALKQMVMKDSNIKKPLPELFQLLKTETGAEDLEPVIWALMKKSKKNQQLFYEIYTSIMRLTLDGDFSDYKLRLLNETLIVLTHDTQSTLFFYQTSMLFLEEVYLFHSSQKANIPLVMLGSLLVSTDHEELLVPVIQEISLSVDSDLPLWIRRRLLGLIFIQAGDSPNIKVAMNAAKRLVALSKTSKNSVIKWESSKRLDYLAKFAKEPMVKNFAANWK